MENVALVEHLVFSAPSRWRNYKWRKNYAEAFQISSVKKSKRCFDLGRMQPIPQSAVPPTAIKPQVPKKVYAWNEIISSHIKDRQYAQALQTFWQMQDEHITSDRYTFVNALKASICLHSLVEGRRIHAQIIQSGLDSDLYVSSGLVNLYGRCLSIEDAHTILNAISRDIVVCSSLITGYVKCGQAEKALDLFRQLLREGVTPESFMFVGAFKACASTRAVEEGRRFYAQYIYPRRCKSRVIVENCLIDMFGNCQSIEDSCNIFNNMRRRDIVSWNAMIAAYIKCEYELKAIMLFQQIRREGLDPDFITFISVLTACTRMQALEEGRHVHAQSIEKQCKSDLIVQNCLLDMYSKCGSIEDSCRLFNRDFKSDLVAWNAMIWGYVKYEKGAQALELYQQMQRERFEPDSVTYVAILTACADMQAAEDGKNAHEHIIKSGLKVNAFIGNSLIDMYSKCGSILDARIVFDNMETPDSVSWNAMIMAHVNAGEGEKALELFVQMPHSDVLPDSVTFASVLNACASALALEEGRFIHSIVVKHGCESDPYVGHCLVNMYAKCGSIEDACRVFNSSTVHDMISWSSIISGYAMNGLAKEALKTFDQMSCTEVEMDGATLISVLSACSHTGFLDEGLYFFDTLSAVYGISPTVDHLCCLIDLLGRAGRLVEAEKMTQDTPCQPDVSVWRALLGACRVHGNVQMAEHIAKKVIDLEPHNASGYVLLSNTYAGAPNPSYTVNSPETRTKAHQYEG